MSAWDGGKSCIFEISQKSNSLIFIFTQAVSDFKMWRERMVDHMCRSTHLWRKTLDITSKMPASISKAWLVNNNIEGINAWDISTMLESFLGGLVPQEHVPKANSIGWRRAWKRLRNVAPAPH